MNAIIAACISAVGSTIAVIVGFRLNQRSTREHVSNVTDAQTRELKKAFGLPDEADPDRWENPSSAV